MYAFEGHNSNVTHVSPDDRHPNEVIPHGPNRVDQLKTSFLPWIDVLQQILVAGADEAGCSQQQWISKALDGERQDLSHASLLNHLLPELGLDSSNIYSLTFDLSKSFDTRASSPITRRALKTSPATASAPLIKLADLTRAQQACRLKELIAKLILHFASTRPTIIVLYLQTGRLHSAMMSQ